MTEIGFYHLTRTELGQALPQLLGRTLAVGQRALVLCRTQEHVSDLDEALWQTGDPEWLPHGSEANGDADLQPIWLAIDDAAPNRARFLFLVDGAETARIAEFDRVFDLFDGSDDGAVEAARRRWKAAKQAGHAMTYWQQGPRGWEKKL
jgi:DNA polymerase III subunit chi